MQELPLQKQPILAVFTHNDAWRMGMLARRICEERSLPVAVSIEKCGQVVCQFGMEGTTPDNDRWMAGKRSVVKLTHRPSLCAKERMLAKGKPPEEAFGLNATKYLCAGGSVPIEVKDVGAIGSITVSGLKDTEDHELALEILYQFWKMKQPGK